VVKNGGYCSTSFWGQLTTLICYIAKPHSPQKLLWGEGGEREEGRREGGGERGEGSREEEGEGEGKGRGEEGGGEGEVNGC